VRKLIQGLNKAFVARGAWLLTACILMVQLGFAADTASIKLVWDASLELSLAGYNVYRSEQPGSYISAPLNGAALLTSPAFTDATPVSGKSYYYVVRSVSNAGLESGPSNEVQITATSTSPPPTVITNLAPIVSAGSGRTLTLPATTTLTATATDDGLPTGTLTYRWTVSPGTGAVLANANSASTQASFSTSGTYTFTVSVSDGALTSTSNVSVVVQAANTPLTAPTGLISSCSADGKSFTLKWNSVGGAQYYYLRADYLANNTATEWLVASGYDHNLDQYVGTSYTAPVISGKAYAWWVHGANAAEGVGPSSAGAFTCNVVPNVAPVVSAGSGQTITLPAKATLTATATDDGLPDNTLTYQWTAASGSGAVLANANSASTQVSFATAGTYMFTVSVSDGALTSTSTVSIVVKAAASLPLTAPSGLTSSCSVDGKSFTVKWNAVASAEYYYLRVDHLANNTATEWLVASGYDHNLDQYAGTSYTAPVISGKAYAWWVHAANAAEGIGPVSSGSFTCNTDVVPPTVNITNPAKGVPVSGTTVTVAASASDNVGVAGVQFKVNGNNLGIEDTSAPYSAIWQTKNLAAGTHTLQAIARDAAGNMATSTATATAKVQKGKMQITVTSLTNDSVVAALQTTQAASASAGPEATASNDGAIATLKSGNIVVSETALAASAPIRNGRVYAQMEGPVSTGLAIANRQTETAVISFFFTDGSGNDFARGSFTLEGNRQITSFFNQQPFNLSASMEGTLTFNSSIPVNVAAFRKFSNERGESLLTMLPVGEVGQVSSAPVIFPDVVQGGGWTSQFIFTNPTDAPLVGSLQFFNQKAGGTSGTPMMLSVAGKTDSMFEYAVAPRGVTRIVIDSTDADLNVGYAVVTPKASTSVPLSLLILSLSNQGFTVSSTGVPALIPGVALRTYFESSSNISLGLAIANPGASPAVVTLEAIASTGDSAVITSTVSILPAGHLSKFITELFPGLPASFQGRLRLSSTQPIAAVGLRVRFNERGDSLYATMPIINEAAAVANGSDLVIPSVLIGDGYTTEYFSIR
jgi:hypothetical protein